MSHEYQIDLEGSSCPEMVEDVRLAVQADGFASTRVREDGSISVLIAELPPNSWGEHAAVHLAPSAVVVAIHTGTRTTQQELLRRVGAALAGHGASGEFREL